MLNYHTRFYNLLKEATRADVYYEVFTKKTATPCVSYMEVNNSVYASGDTMRFSNISFQVKVWSSTILEANAIASDISSHLEANGFRQVSSQDLYDGNEIMKVMRFNAIGYEMEV